VISTYIVVALGTAAASSPTGLSANPANRVLILEAGGFNDNWIWFPTIPGQESVCDANPTFGPGCLDEPEAGLKRPLAVLSLRK